MNLHVSLETEEREREREGGVGERERESVVVSSWFLSDEFSSHYERQASLSSIGCVLVITF